MFLIDLFLQKTLKPLRFKSSDLFGIHTALDKSMRALKLPTHLFNLTVNG